ncbi:hypothetical protein DB346_00855 [Verrucomicrobia bacterium LW23]|nr:hypothetical protein DB346_00855 [Verrucomicrobia bacterium LW23]
MMTRFSPPHTWLALAVALLLSPIAPTAVLAQVAPAPRMPTQPPIPTAPAAPATAPAATAPGPEGAEARRLSASTTLRSNPDTTPPPAEVAEAIVGFFTELKQGNSIKAYDILLRNTRIREQREQVDALIQRTGTALGLYGRVTAAELYDHRRLGSRIIVLTYLSYSEMQPLRWRFVYYKPNTTWIMINLDCDDKLNTWYEQ